MYQCYRYRKMKEYVDIDAAIEYSEFEGFI